MHVKTIWVYGVGGVGGLIGGKIARSLGKERGADTAIYFIARGEHLRQIQTSGLILNMGDEKGIICTPTLATDNPGTLEAPDLCFVCVKSYDLEGVSRSLAKAIREETVLIPLLNGVNICERIRKIVQKGIVLPACIYVGTHIEKPGVVTQRGGEGRMLLGQDPMHPDFYPDEILQLLQRAHIPFQWFEDVSPSIWEKYLFIAAFGLVTAAYGKTLGEIASDAELMILASGIMKEVFLIAKKKQIALPPDVVNASIAKANNFPYETKTSYQRDLEEHGKQNEGDLFGATIMSMGRDLGVPTPIAESVYNKILGKISR
ncbi:MAG TPA: 2-dehydropantoate 2-reductase [Syntrophorhabdaceae bacterium]|nr:2-dehydropantoate 2-reductase [Syntrophorhabdaceae bacterium]